jgi:hypothetical protein
VTIRGPLAWVFAVVLLLSVAANLLIAGLVLGRLHGPPLPDGDFQHVLSMVVRPFPPEIQQSILTAAAADREELNQQYDALQAARRRAFDAMRADPFDRAALDSAHADFRNGAEAMQQRIQNLEADAIAKAPADVRQKIRPPRRPFS